MIDDTKLADAYYRPISGIHSDEDEAIIATSARYSYAYACDIIKARFELGEAAIARSPSYAYYYARNIIEGPWPPGEATIATSPTYAYLYAREVIKGRFELGEALIAKTSHAWMYAAYILEGRWIECEPYVMRDRTSMFSYIRLALNLNSMISAETPLLHCNIEKLVEVRASCDTNTYV